MTHGWHASRQYDSVRSIQYNSVWSYSILFRCDYALLCCYALLSVILTVFIYSFKTFCQINQISAVWSNFVCPFLFMTFFSDFMLENGDHKSEFDVYFYYFSPDKLDSRISSLHQEIFIFDFPFWNSQWSLKTVAGKICWTSLKLVWMVKMAGILMYGKSET